MGLLPEGPFLYPPDDHTDLPEAVRLAELVREQVLRRTREELPHAVEVEVSEIETRADGLLMVRAQVWAESESQKAILVGCGRADGQGDRHRGAASEIERARGERMHLELQVRVRKRLAPRRGAARPAGHRVTERERIRAFLRESEEAVCDEVRPARHGTALLTPSLPQRVAAERPARGGPGRGARAGDGGGRGAAGRPRPPQAARARPRAGARLAPQLARLGLERERACS